MHSIMAFTHEALAEDTKISGCQVEASLSGCQVEASLSGCQAEASLSAPASNVH